MFSVPKFRVGINYITHTGDGPKRKELPLRLLVLGDYTLREPGMDDVLANRSKIRVDSDSLNEVMKEQNIALNLAVPNCLGAEPGEEMIIDLRISDLCSFRPEAVVSQVEELSMLMEIRTLLEGMHLQGVREGQGAILEQLQAKIHDTPRPHEERSRMAGLARILLGRDQAGQVDEEPINTCIAGLDEVLSRQLDEMLHHDKFRQLESAWQSLGFLLNRIDFNGNVSVDVLSVSKEELAQDFERSGNPLESGLFMQVYTQAYDQYGADPISLMVADYEFDNGPEGIKLLNNIAAVAAVAQCPFIAAAGPGLFGVSSFDEFAQIPNLATILDTPDHLDWRSFRGSKESLYAGLTLPKFLLRLPYGGDANRVEGFNYKENFGTEHHDEYLWGKASFALASNIARSFSNFGWPVNFLGVQSGGLIENLPIHVHEAGVDTVEYRIPLEIKIPDVKEAEFADNGFIPLLVHEGRNIEACFVSANSVHQVEINDDEGVSARNRSIAELSCIGFEKRH